jgi:hypothetical protein
VLRSHDATETPSLKEGGNSTKPRLFTDVAAEAEKRARHRDLLFFVAGLVFSIPIGILVNILSK